jgi:hypothetical protein
MLASSNAPAMSAFDPVTPTSSFINAARWLPAQLLTVASPAASVAVMGDHGLHIGIRRRISTPILSAEDRTVAIRRGTEIEESRHVAIRRRLPSRN